MNKRYALAGLAGVVAFSAVAASAATLGGLDGKQLGADSAVVGSCDTDGVDLAYTTSYSATAGEYQVSGVTVTGIAAACSGQSLSVTLSDGSASLGSGTATVSGTSQSFSLTPVAADAVTDAAVVISG